MDSQNSVNSDLNQNDKQTDVSQLEKTQKELDDLTQIIAENVHKVINRGINLSELNQSCEYLQEQSRQFNRTSRKARFKIYLKNKKFSLAICICVFMFLLIVSILLYIFVIKK